MSNVLDVYMAALNRLKDGCPQVMPVGARITNDSVALEAGRQKGSIKKSRTVFAEIIQEIAKAASDQTRPKDDRVSRAKAAKEQAKDFRRLWEEALEREVSLLLELMEARKEIAKLTGGKVFPIRRSDTSKLN